jgi:hypothetical protein
MNAAISGTSKLNRVNRSARGTSPRSMSHSTNRATGSSPAARSLKNNNLLKTFTIVKKREKIINMNYVLRNPPRVYRQQRAGRPATYRAERTAENSRHVRAVLPVHRLVKQLWPYVVQRCSHN